VGISFCVSQLFIVDKPRSDGTWFLGESIFEDPLFIVLSRSKHEGVKQFSLTPCDY
jgi:hypothetical protein